MLRRASAYRRILAIALATATAASLIAATCGPARRGIIAPPSSGDSGIVDVPTSTPFVSIPANETIVAIPTETRTPTASITATATRTPTPTRTNTPTRTSTPTSTPVSVPAIALQTVVTGLSAPVAITHAGDGSGRIFVTEQSGAIRIIEGGVLLPTPFLDLSSLIAFGGEQGLLSVAFHPDYATNGYLYVDYTDTNGDTVIARYTRSAGNVRMANPASALIIKTIDQPYDNHNGGQLQFGPDGYLYIGMGDGGSGGDPENRAQDINSLLGKMLRIDVDHGSPYTSPATNPYVGKAGADEIWALGLRNPWRFSFDRTTGDLWIGDVGQDSQEEIDFQPAASIGGENYGWRLMEGTACYNPGSNCNPGGLTLPLLHYTHASGDCAVTGGYRYRGPVASLVGIYFYSDYCSGKIRAAVPAGGGWSSSTKLSSGYNISGFGEDEAGNVYVADNSGGGIYKIILAP